MNIRLATTQDYHQIAKIRNLLIPDFHETSEKMIESDKLREKKIKFCRWVAEVDSKIVGEIYYNQPLVIYHPNQFVIDAVVLPEHQNKGIGSALYKAVTEALTQFDPIHYHVYARENLPQGIKFLTKHDFKETARERIAHLDVQSFNFTNYSDLEKKLMSNSITFKKLHELKNDPDYEQRLYELEWELVSDIPDLKETLVKQTFDEWHKNSLNHPEIIQDAYHVAIKDGEYIGYSYLWGGSKKDLIHNGMTGVKKEFRGYGIATMLKILGVNYSKDNGYKILWTCNSLTNIPVLAINEKLGYEKQYEIVEMIKTLRKE